MYMMLLSMALLAIFDTQVLAVFRRRKEMGTMMALGMPRGKVIGLFTLEGALHGILALVVGAVYGVPLLMFTASKGIPLPKEMMDSTGFAISDILYPVYGMGLVVGTTLLILSPSPSSAFCRHAESPNSNQQTPCEVNFLKKFTAEAQRRRGFAHSLRPCAFAVKYAYDLVFIKRLITRSSPQPVPGDNCESRCDAHDLDSLLDVGRDRGHQ